MFKHRSQLLSLWFAVSDIVLTVAAWLFSHFLRFDSGIFAVEKDPPTFALCVQNAPLVILVSLFAYRITGQFQIHRFRRLREEFVGVFIGTALMGLLLMAATFGLHSSYESRGAILLFIVLAMAFILAFRRVSWAGVHWLRSRGYNQTQTLIVGTGRVARKTARALRTTSWLGFKNVGFIEDKPTHWASDLDILGTINDLSKLVQKYQVSHVFICLPMSRFDDARRVFDTLSQTFADVRLIVDLPALAGVSFTTTNFDGMPMVGLRESPLHGMNIVVKRVMDVLLSFFGILFISPLLLLIAALVKVTSPGPVFYSQERCGLNGHRFRMLKFRSMRIDAEQKTGAVWACKDDPRKTKLGTFLRKTSLDELPQLFNVLMGDMSLVGPRPERPVFIDKFEKTIPNYQVRHAMQAGITGWAQVNGWRGDTSLRKRIQFDLYYITHWTPWLDLRILWLTIWHGFVNRNAY
ncbi:MAG: undecaprenyl-phosphate glucose phosphotransferase [Gemmataceae bacterium]|nr:undecaprenyl-phosphate glucose phosphotransferase [Gemmataceae bacterium]